MATVLLKKLIVLQHSFDLLTVVAAITLSSKYQHSSSHIIDYQLLAQYCHIDNIQQIHVSLSFIISSLHHHHLLSIEY
jgi:hypothetical protein